MVAQTRLGVWRSATAISGALCVMTYGAAQMLKWSVYSWDSKQQVSASICKDFSPCSHLGRLFIVPLAVPGLPILLQIITKCPQKQLVYYFSHVIAHHMIIANWRQVYAMVPHLQSHMIHYNKINIGLSPTYYFTGL